jgi:hypothetical protein
VPLAVSDLSLYFISALTPILIVQLLNLRDLCAKTPDFFTKNCEMIHDTSITSMPGRVSLAVSSEGMARNTAREIDE